MADFNDGLINPATGLPMLGGVDVGGNSFGMGGTPPHLVGKPTMRIPWREMSFAQKLFAGSFATVVLGTIAWNLLEKVVF